MSPNTTDKNLDQMAVNTIRFLSADGVEKAKSGHPGLPMGAADYAYVLWAKYLKYNPNDPKWQNRDRFVLSGGHGSMLLYSLLHLAGYDMPMEQLKQFRQWGSHTAGHPEYDIERGIETTTGPLGQGISNAVGMAMAAKRLAAIFNKPGYDIVNNTIYAVAGDGDMMEGISHESCSLAGHLGLDNLVLFYDDNNITIEGNTCLAYTDDVKKRFESYNWYVQAIDGHDRDAIQKAIDNAKLESTKPSLIICKTQIGKGAPNKANTASAHGEPLGEEEIKAAKEAVGWPVEPAFYVPDEVYDIFKKTAESNKAEYDAWNELVKKYTAEYPEEAKLWNSMMSKEVPANIEDIVIPNIDCAKANATRNSSGIIMQELSKLVPSLWGGSADLSPSTKTDIKGEESFCNNKYVGKNIHFGVREHGMGSAMNGMALYGGFIPYGSTFLIFSDYLRPVVRLASLMKQHVIYVFTHDSIFVGEDGPTHEPIEQIPSLRMINGVRVIRPADTSETAVAWAVALESNCPTALMLTRQNVPALSDNPMDAKQLRKGAYIVKDVENPDTIIIATGSEVHISVEAADMLAQKGIKARVVSMPCTDLFDMQDETYKNSIIPPNVTKRVAVEAAAPYGWHKYVGCGGLVIGMDRFGASAPYKVLAEKFGFTSEQIADKVEAYIKR